VVSLLVSRFGGVTPEGGIEPGGGVVVFQMSSNRRQQVSLDAIVLRVDLLVCELLQEASAICVVRVFFACDMEPINPASTRRCL
jgi:hypothetical protein